MNRKILLACIVGLVVIGCAIFAYVQSDNGEKVEEFVIIHTNDSHCHYDDEDSLGFSTVAALREQYSEKYKTVFTIDAGDFMQGTSYGTLTKGKASIELMDTIVPKYLEQIGTITEESIQMGRLVSTVEA